MKPLRISWADGYRSKVDAEVAYNELQNILKETGELDPHDIVDRARSKDSPLHPEIYRETDKVAAKEWRTERVRRCTRSILVVRPDIPHTEVRAFEVMIAPVKDKPNRQVYQDHQAIMEDPIARSELYARAIHDLEAFQRRYATLQELGRIIAVIREHLESA